MRNRVKGAVAFDRLNDYIDPDRHPLHELDITSLVGNRIDIDKFSPGHNESVTPEERWSSDRRWLDSVIE